ncbi:unnamed protein product, partial [Fusarium fujikuroi]
PETQSEYIILRDIRIIYIKDNLLYFKDRLYILIEPNFRKEILKLYYNNPLDISLKGKVLEVKYRI